MGNWTKGPWTVEGSYIMAHESDFDFDMICDNIYEEANARLISAAPDMAEALELCIEHMEWSTPQGKAAREAAKKALRKAKGE